MRTTNLISSNGNSVPNQFMIKTDEGTFFQSYESIIAKINKDGKVFLDEKYWKYSTTTSKYRNIFLGETSRETEAKVKSGEYTLTDLNK